MYLEKIEIWYEDEELIEHIEPFLQYLKKKLDDKEYTWLWEWAKEFGFEEILNNYIMMYDYETKTSNMYSFKQIMKIYNTYDKQGIEGWREIYFKLPRILIHLHINDVKFLSELEGASRYPREIYECFKLFSY